MADQLLEQVRDAVEGQIVRSQDIHLSENMYSWQ